MTRRIRPLEFLLCAALTAGIAVPIINAKTPPQNEAKNEAWPLVGGDLTNERFSPLAQIDTQNVKQLGAAWVSPKFDGSAASRAMPVITDGMMFLTAGSNVYALDAKTGQFLWKYSTDATLTGSEMAIGRQSALTQIESLSNSGHLLPNSQGVAVAEGKVFFGRSDGHVVALDEKSGKLLWDRQASDVRAKDNQGLLVPTAPTYAEGEVFVGTNGDYGGHAKIVALDAKTGALLWQFNVVPEPGQPGHETWPTDNYVSRHGGGGVWQTGAVDPELGLVYFGTGNAVPQYGGEIRPGTNLYTDCVVALDIKTGKLRWYRQLVHHDIWEADVAEPVILYDTKIDGKAVKAVAAMRPDGYLFLFDRVTGNPLVPIVERPVTQSAFQKTLLTQPFPDVPEGLLPNCDSWKSSVPEGWSLDCEFVPWDFGSKVLAPGFTVRATPLAYSAATGYFYAQGSGSIRPHRLITDDPWFFALGSGDLSLIGLPPARSFIAAIDGRTDKVVWKKEVPASELGRGFSGPATNAGGLLFHGASDGILEAYDAKNGDLLWQFQTDGEGGPVATYELGGQEYVAMVAGPTVWAFKLGGTIPPVKIERSRATVAAASDAGAVDTDQVETATLVKDHDNSGQRFAVDEDTFNPTKARVKVGARVFFVNNGRIPHTIVAEDGTWTTGTLQPADSAGIEFDKPGKHVYYTKERPWALGEIIVENETAAASANGLYTPEQADRGKMAYEQSCAGCHESDLGGNAQFPALKGDAFMAEWQGHKLSDLSDRIRTTMPQGSPGSLSEQTYLDVIAYMLRMNDMPAGKNELKTESLSNSIGK